MPTSAKKKTDLAQKATPIITARQFIEKLKTYQSDTELKKYHRFFNFVEKDKKDTFIGVRMGQVFALAKESIDMPAIEIEKLLESHIHEIRAGAVSIMDKQSRSKKTNETQRKEIFNLYMRRHDRINNWDLVDLGCLYMTGSYLFDKSRTILYKLVKSKNVWERRTAMVSTVYFLKQKETEDAFKIAGLLIKDQEDTVHKAMGWMLRIAGDIDRDKLVQFLDKHGAAMPRVALRYAIEHLDKKQRDDYLSMKKTRK